MEKKLYMELMDLTSQGRGLGIHWIQVIIINKEVLQ